MYSTYILTLFCILTSILLLDSNRETISLYPLYDAHINAVYPSYIIYIHISIFISNIFYIPYTIYIILYHELFFI